MWTFASVPACSQQAIFHSDHIIFSKCCFSQLRISCHGTETKYWLHPVHVSERARPVCIFCALPNNSHGILEIRPLHTKPNFHVWTEHKLLCFYRTVQRGVQKTHPGHSSLHMCVPYCLTPSPLLHRQESGRVNKEGSGQCQMNVKRIPDNICAM